jgi:hypothetical protein
MTSPNIFGLIGVIIFGLALSDCAPAPPPPYYTLYNVQPYPPPEYSAPPRAPEIPPVVVIPAPAPEVVPPTVDRGPEPFTAPPPPSNPRSTELPPVRLPPPDPPPPVEGGNKDDCVGWWRICHFL